MEPPDGAGYRRAYRMMRTNLNLMIELKILPQK